MIISIELISSFIIQINNILDMLIYGNGGFDCDCLLISLLDNIRFIFLLWELQYTRVENVLIEIVVIENVAVVVVE